MPQQINHDEALGQAIADFLHLAPLPQKKIYPKPIYQTTWGKKTAQGIGASIRHLIADHSELLNNTNTDT